jgi:Ca2+-binding EF-hand superfamily protein
MGHVPGWLIGLLVSALIVSGQETPAAQESQPAGPLPSVGGAGPQGSGLDPGTLFRLSRQMDTNGDLLLDDEELDAGFRQLGHAAAAVRTDLLAWLDKDRNGTLSPDEWKPFFTAMWMLSVIRGVDRNDDLTLQEDELAAALARMDEFRQKANGHTLRQYDRDMDGQLSQDEVQAARQAMRRFSPRGPGSGKGHSGDRPDADAGGGSPGSIDGSVEGGKAPSADGQ